MGGFVTIFIVVALAVMVLRGFDRVAGRGPKQVADGIDQSSIGRRDAGRVPYPNGAESILRAEKMCPFCAETIKAEAKLCRFCGRDLPPDPAVTAAVAAVAPAAAAESAESAAIADRVGFNVAKVVLVLFGLLLLYGLVRQFLS